MSDWNVLTCSARSASTALSAPVSFPRAGPTGRRRGSRIVHHVAGHCPAKPGRSLAHHFGAPSLICRLPINAAPPVASTMQNPRPQRRNSFLVSVSVMRIIPLQIDQQKGWPLWHTPVFLISVRWNTDYVKFCGAVIWDAALFEIEGAQVLEDIRFKHRSRRHILFRLRGIPDVIQLTQSLPPRPSRW